MRLAIIFLLVELLFCIPAYSQWQPTNGPAGGPVYDIEKIGQYIFLNAGAGGVYRSEDGGNNWRVINNGLPNNPHCYAIASTPTTLYAAIYSHGIYKSSDLGITWTAAGTGTDGKTFYSLLADGNDVYAGESEGGFYHSDNQGATWTKKGDGLGSIRGLLVAGGNLFIAGHNTFGHVTIYKSPDKGNTLLHVYGPPSAFNVMGGYDNVIYLTGSPMRISRDYGVTWTITDLGLDESLFSNAIYAFEDKVIVQGSSSRMFISSDEGLTWDEISDVTYPGNIYTVHQEESTIILGGSHGMYISDNNGTSWVEKNAGLNNLIITHLEAAGNTLFAGTGAGIFSTEDNGMTWQKLNNGLQDNTPTILNEGVVIKGIHSHLSDLVVATSRGIFKSPDNGHSWEIKQSLQDADPNTRFHILAGDKQKLFSCENGHQYYSDSGGETWSVRHNPIFKDENIHNATVKGDTIVVLALNKLFVSKNFGASWQPLQIGTSSFYPNDAVFFGNDLYVATTQGLFICKYQRTSFTKVVGPPTQMILSLFVRNDGLYAGTDRGLVVAPGFGLGWNEINGGLNDVYMKPIAYNETHIFAGTYGSSVWRTTWADLNVRPRIAGLSNPLYPTDDLTIRINLSDLLVSDLDNNFPEDFTLTIKPGANYIIEGNVVTPNPDFSGVLNIPLVVNDGRSDSNEYIATVNIELVTAIGEFNDVFEFFPNPTSHKINFKIPQGIQSYTLLDVAGRKVTNQTDISIFQQTLILDVSSLPPGTYMLAFHGRKTHIRRFVKY